MTLRKGSCLVLGGLQLSGTWRAPSASDLQIGQLLYYLMAVQLRRLFISPCSNGAQQPGPPTPVLGIYMEDGMVRYTLFGSLAHF